MRVSYSALDTFNVCPAKYKFQYIDKIKTPKSKESIFGTLLHSCLKKFHEVYQNRPISQDELLQYFTDLWDGTPYADEKEEAFAFYQGIEILKNYYNQNQGLNFNILDLETPFEVPVQDENKELHQITGRIDRIDKLSDGRFEVVDYKTSKKMPSQEMVDNNLQLSVYYLGLINRWPSLKNKNNPIKLSLYYLRHGEKLSAEGYTSEKITENTNKILSIIHQIKKSGFEPVANPLCDWCEYQPYCPLFKHKFIKEESPTPDENKIQEIIKEYFSIKEKEKQHQERLNELKSEINKYCDENGLDRIFGDNGYITRNHQTRVSYDYHKVKQILAPLGKWEEVLSLDNAKLKKIIHELPHQTQKQIEEKAKKDEKEFKVISANINKK
jgi:RecB family exonuclease